MEPGVTAGRLTSPLSVSTRPLGDRLSYGNAGNEDIGGSRGITLLILHGGKQST